MNEETLTALVASAKKWDEHSVAVDPGNISLGSSSCPLCLMFTVGKGPICDGCPVMAASGLTGCRGTPFIAASQARRAYTDIPTKKYLDAFHQAAKNEADFLWCLVPGGRPAMAKKTLLEVTSQLFARYSKILLDDWHKNKKDPYAHVNQASMEHLYWMCVTAQERDMPIDKASRWLGFVQGCLVMRGLLDVDEERDYTRPLFKDTV